MFQLLTQLLKWWMVQLENQNVRLGSMSAQVPKACDKILGMLVGRHQYRSHLSASPCWPFNWLSIFFDGNLSPRLTPWFSVVLMPSFHVGIILAFFSSLPSHTAGDWWWNLPAKSLPMPHLFQLDGSSHDKPWKFSIYSILLSFHFDP